LANADAGHVKEQRLESTSPTGRKKADSSAAPRDTRRDGNVFPAARRKTAKS
jgi:hypothetical protein